MDSSLNMRKIALLILSAAFVFTSCQRDGTKVTPYELTEDDKGFGTDHALMEFVNDDVEAIADIAMYDNAATFNGCTPYITHDTNLNRLVINFGAECKDNNDVIRSGKIIVDYTLPYWDSGSVRTIRFDDYYYQGMRLTGYKQIENRGYNNAGRLYHSIIVGDTLHLGSNLGYISYNSERNRVWLNGFNTLGNVQDDTYELTGSGSIKRGNGAHADFNILTELLVSTSCKYIMAGELQLIPLNGYARVINYGEGDCDDDATLDLNGNMFDIKLSE